MPTKLISDEEKISYASEIDNIFETFCTDILIVNEVANLEVDNEDNYNAFSDSNSSNTTYTAETSTIKAVLKYLDKQDQENALLFNAIGSDGEIAANVRQDYGVIRVKIRAADWDIVKDATKLIIDGYDCQILFTNKPRGLFATNYQLFYVVRKK